MIAGIGQRKYAAFACFGLACLSLVVSLRILGSELSAPIPRPATRLPTSLSGSQSDFCAKLFDHHYFDSFTETPLGICSDESTSNIVCYKTHIALKDTRDDFFCFISQALVQADLAQLTADCSIKDLHFKSRLPKYMYDTTIKDGFDAMRLEANSQDARLASSCGPERTSLALVRREGAEHTWDCLLEIFSFFLTIELMRYHNLIAVDEKIQVVFLDNHPDGPYGDLWSMFGHATPIRMANLWERGDTCVDRVILPLPGGSNPLFQGDWTRFDCQHSTLVRDFRKKAEQHYGLENRRHRRPEDQTHMTIIHRNKTRRLLDHGARVKELSSRYPKVRVQEIDLATMDFPSQIRLVQDTDVLVGVHGAGLTHILFLSTAAVVVEILPANVNYEGFRNLARLQGVRYLRRHGQIVPQGTDWHAADILLPEEDFEDLMGIAVDLATERFASPAHPEDSL